MYVSNLLKVVAAFVGGVVVALGSALIYVRVTQTTPPAPVAQLATPPLATPPQTAAPPHDSGLTQAPEQAEKTDEAVPKPVHKAHPVKHRTPAVHKAEEPADLPVLIAQNTPRPTVAPKPAAETQAPPAATSQLPADPQPTAQDPQSAARDPQPAPQDPPPAPQPHVVTLPEGTTVAIRLGETLSTEHNYTGDTFRATLDQEIDADGFIIAEKGSKVLGRIVNAQKAGRVQGVSDLNLTLFEINTTDGQRIQVRTNASDRKGPTTTGEDAAKIAGGAALGAIIGALAGGGKGAAIGAGAGGAAGTGVVLTTRGKPVIMPAETRLSFQLSSPITITEQINH